ncbi:hypothetical protein U1Q18_046046 [Sarracenia purpurea var. burkii]
MDLLSEHVLKRSRPFGLSDEALYVLIFGICRTIEVGSVERLAFGNFKVWDLRTCSMTLQDSRRRVWFLPSSRRLEKTKSRVVCAAAAENPRPGDDLSRLVGKTTCGEDDLSRLVGKTTCRES